MRTLIASVSASFAFALMSNVIVTRALTDRIAIVGSLVGLERVENAGIAFGIGLPPWLIAVLIPAILLFILIVAYRSRSNVIHSVGYGLIIGGALANIVDRLQDGLVTDFIQVGWWPVFNVADSWICVGVGVLVFYELLCRKNPKSEIRNPKYTQRPN